MHIACAAEEVRTAILSSPALAGLESLKLGTVLVGRALWESKGQRVIYHLPPPKCLHNYTA